MQTQEKLNKAEGDGWYMGYNDFMYENPYNKDLEPELWEAFDSAFWEGEWNS